MSAGEDRGNQIVDDFDLADDAPGDLVSEPFACLCELLEQLQVALVGAVLLA
jgi:hypothetical protein